MQRYTTYDTSTCFHQKRKYKMNLFTLFSTFGAHYILISAYSGLKETPGSEVAL